KALKGREAKLEREPAFSCGCPPPLTCTPASPSASQLLCIRSKQH
ncbi:hypothetical protein LEMLEM_LOCUS3463, partial [Lemmus lemmus]